METAKAREMLNRLVIGFTEDEFNEFKVKSVTIEVP